MQCLSCKAACHDKSARKSLKVITDARNLSAPEEHSDNMSDDESQLMCDTAMQDEQDMNHSSDNDITLHERVQMLNVEQKRIYEKVKMHMLHVLLRESEECSCEFKPLRMFVLEETENLSSFMYLKD